MTTIQVDDQVAEVLCQQAQARGISVSDLLRTLVRTDGPEQLLGVDQFDSELDKVALPGPTLAADFSRADIYSERD